ncbi:SAM-dependent methyltransferase [Mycolicibacter nonchromogenicus]|uniref:S-adenosyl-L-methionine-dependent methyltransferase n=1 Tax=Mycolicibacter nonchromogenicus TaxID=1782 RepID=A0A1X1ZHQ1_MYCNO|nr:SAM-dependent methyltransferase [Mycolicibacter nonchromogenicus]ORW22846.1 SAM-dependent methyltransferase [Mycolicibacter nonchromogenicus]
MSTASREQDDAGSLASGAGVMATVLAAARAAAVSRELINDPFAAPLVHKVGLEFCIRVADGELDISRLGTDGGFPRFAEFSAARTHFFDAFFTDAGRAGIRQAVILGAGLDTRAYRLWWPPETIVYEVDHPHVVDFKTIAMRAWDATPSVDRRAVGVGLRGDWPAALRRVGFDAAAPTVWVIEGLLVWYVPSDAQNRLLDGVTGLSAPGSRLAADHAVPPSRPQAVHHESLVERWRRRGLSLTGPGPFYSGEHTDVVRHLTESGWATTQSGIADLFEAARLPRLSDRELDGAPAAIRYVEAIRR